MSLDTRIRDMFTPNYTGLKTADGFWGRVKNYVTTDSQIEDILDRAALQGKSETVLNRLEQITKRNFENFGKDYFDKPVLGTIARYLGYGANTLGSITAGGALLSLAAGGPLTAVAAVGYGLGWILTGGALNTGADLYDSLRTHHALGGKKSVLELLKKDPKGIWRKVTRPTKLVKPLSEGLMENALPYFGSGLIGKYLGSILGGATPYAQVAAMSAGSFAFYRGGKKFDDLVVDYIKDRSLEQFVQELSPATVTRPVRPLKERLKRLDTHYLDDHVYGAMRPKASKRRIYIMPRTKGVA
jgi:hypothetical protein